MDFYDSDYADSYYDDDDDMVVDDDDVLDSADISNSVSETYTVLKECDIRERQEREITHVSSTLSISEVAASKLLHHFRWNVSQLHDEWFADERLLRDKVGLPDKRSCLNHDELVTCGICYDEFRVGDIYPTRCGHDYCEFCWKRYITTSIDAGPGCLTLKCPEPSCSVAVCRDVIKDIATEEEYRRYSRYFLRSFVEESKKLKWCPAPGCENAVELELGDGVFDVTCLCSCTFCWNCGEDAHRPVKCDTVAKWVLKNKSESENTLWILANSKACPKCRRPIEKNHGCMHMTCTPPCKYEFCWLCLGDWKAHGGKTGGNYSCNIYQSGKRNGLYDEEERIRESAKKSAERYTHYYERWASNQKSRDKAIQDLHNLQAVKLKKLSDKSNEPVTQLTFITDAWKQIIECRRVLKWTYAYGYYLPVGDHIHREFFEYSQGEAESNLERLHKCAEMELDLILNEKEKTSNAEDDDSVFKEEDFVMFRQKLSHLTAVTRSFFTKLVASLETPDF